MSIYNTNNKSISKLINIIINYFLLFKYFLVKFFTDQLYKIKLSLISII